MPNPKKRKKPSITKGRKSTKKQEVAIKKKEVATQEIGAIVGPVRVQEEVLLLAADRPGSGGNPPRPGSGDPKPHRPGSSSCDSKRSGSGR
jgi:hypothetical protein